MNAKTPTSGRLSALATVTAGQRVVASNARWVEHYLRDNGFDLLAERARRSADDAESLIRLIEDYGRGRSL